jgi:hypothetical protein
MVMYFYQEQWITFWLRYFQGKIKPPLNDGGTDSTGSEQGL